MTIRDVVVGALDLIRQGWCQRRSCCERDGRTCYCVTYAIVMSAAQAADESSYPDLVAGAIAAVRRLLPSLSAGYGVAHWNDAAGRTQQEVIDKLDEVINSLPEEASENTAVRA